MNNFLQRWPALAGFCLVVFILFGGCAKMKQEKHEKAIRARYSEAITALCKGNYNGWAAVVAPEVRASETKVKLVWAGLRVATGISQPNPDDFRIDRVSFDEQFTTATVNTSRQTKGEWKPEDKPLQWVRMNDVWYVKF
jgi:hypothetical protein